MKPSNTIVVSPKYIEEKEHQIADFSKTIARLQKQLKEAHNVIKKYMSVMFEIRSEEEKPTVLRLSFDYLKKWGVK